VPPSPKRVWRRLSLRQRLLLIAAAAILPLALMAAAALHALLNEQRQQAQRGTLDLARALATAVDTELRLTVSALQSLAAVETASPGPESTAALYRLAAEVLHTRPEWRAVLLTTPAGDPVFSTSRPLGSSLPPPAEPESLHEAVATREPRVGTLARGALGGEGFAVRVPVIEDGQLRYVLSAVVKPDAILQVLARQRVPRDWIVSIFDAKMQRVARSRDHAAQLGTAPSPSLRRLWSHDAVEGTGESTTVEGERVYTAYSRLPATGWTVTVGVPVAAVDASARQSAIVYGGGVLLSIALGWAAAALLGGTIARPIARLGEAARAIGRGEAPAHEPADLAEVEAVGTALVDAAHQRERAAAEREELLVAERLARAAAEHARQRLELLAAAGEQLSRSLEERTTLEAIGQVVVPALGDWCRIDLLDEQGVLRRKLTHHRDPERQRVVDEFAHAGHVVSAAQPGSFPYAIRTGEAYLANFESWEDPAIGDPTLRTFARLTGLRSTCVVPLVARGRVLGAMGVVQAESGRRFSPDDAVLIQELAQRVALALDNVRLYAEAQAALREAELASRAKDEFLAMLGHELRNPLAPIVSSLELMGRRAPAAIEPQRRVIERQVAHLSGLVDDLLDVSRIAAGKVRLGLERIDLCDVLGRALEAAQPVLADRVVDLIAPAGAAWVMGDALRLRQVVGNLLANAAKFTRPADRIWVELSLHDREAQLVVADEGVGIAPELLGRVFERFVQGEQALQRAQGGLGLGLAIARSLVELHQGSIRAQSDGPGRGARFTVTLPLASHAAATGGEPSTPAPPLPAGARVLVVDDNADAADALAELLRLEGYTVQVAGSAEEALTLLEHGELPQVALLDIGLPAMNGYDLARALRTTPRTQAMRLVAITGYGRSPDRQRALDAGFDEHFVKPAPLDELLARIAALVAGESELA
jgi:signal transduction histidine kinase/ActR/RegA family two-component response regulator